MKRERFAFEQMEGGRAFPAPQSWYLRHGSFNTARVLIFKWENPGNPLKDIGRITYCIGLFWGGMTIDSAYAVIAPYCFVSSIVLNNPWSVYCLNYISAHKYLTGLCLLEKWKLKFFFSLLLWFLKEGPGLHLPNANQGLPFSTAKWMKLFISQDGNALTWWKDSQSLSNFSMYFL